MEEFLFVHGDKPASGNRAGDLTVRSMIEETREFSPGVRIGAAAGLRPLPVWKRAADFLFVQVSFSLEALLRWRDANQVEVPVYAGVMVLAIRDSGAFDGVHLVPVSRYRDVESRLAGAFR